MAQKSVSPTNGPLRTPKGALFTHTPKGPQMPNIDRRTTFSVPIGPLTTTKAHGLLSSPNTGRGPLGHTKIRKTKLTKPQRAYRVPTMTTMYYGKIEKIKVIPFSIKRGTLLLSEPLAPKQEKLEDARDKSLAKLRSTNQKLEQELEELKSLNRKLVMDNHKILTEKTGLSQQKNSLIHEKTAFENRINALNERILQLQSAQIVQNNNAVKIETKEKAILEQKYQNSLKEKDKRLNEKEKTIQERDTIIHTKESKINEYKGRLQILTESNQELKIKLEQSRGIKDQIQSEKQRLESEYGQIKDRLLRLQTHSILMNVKTVNTVLNMCAIQREFFDEIFDEKANIHKTAFEHLRKEIKKMNKYFNKSYCKQMAFKILFEIIHICNDKINGEWKRMYGKIFALFGITAENSNGNIKLIETIDFVIKYQFREILGNLCDAISHKVIEEIYEIDFELIKSHNSQNILHYNLHSIANPMQREQSLCEYIHKICIVCWKMLVFNHDKSGENKLIFYPLQFIEADKTLKLNNDIYDKCTAHCEKKCDQILFYVFPIVMHSKHKNEISSALPEIDEKLDTDLEQQSQIRIKVVTRHNITSSLSKSIGQNLGSKPEPLQRVGVTELLIAPPSMANICESFTSIHKQEHKNLCEAIQDFCEENEENKEFEIRIDDGDILEMKIYKILFDVLVTCYVRMDRVIQSINDKLSANQLKYDNTFVSFMNLQFYYTEFNKNRKENEQIRMILSAIDSIYDKYCKLYTFLGNNEAEFNIRENTRTYIMKCCQCIFHFKAYSVSNADNDSHEYGLYPLCFVRDGQSCAVLDLLQERNLNNDIIDVETVQMGTSDGLCAYNDALHEKESSSDIDNVTNAKICYFTWPAIVTANKNNEYIYGNVPRKYLTKIWVLLNNEVYQMVNTCNEQ